MKRKILAFVVGILLCLALPSQIVAFSKGIYITSSTAQVPKNMRYLMREAKATGIDTFIIDYYFTTKRYRETIAAVKKNKIRFVARIVVFPWGATHSQVVSKEYLEKRWRQIKGAIDLGADAIQLDYIRYTPKQSMSDKNALYIHEVIRFFRNKMRGSGVKLQIDVFGVATIKPARAIGQDLPLFANTVDTINPMVYPSHYEPYRYHAVRPYSTVLESMRGVRLQLRKHPHVRVHAFIELYNYRYPLSKAQKIDYIRAQIKAARDAGADGWYAWSAQNKYAILFHVLKNYKQ